MIGMTVNLLHLKILLWSLDCCMSHHATFQLHLLLVLWLLPRGWNPGGEWGVPAGRHSPAGHQHLQGSFCSVCLWTTGEGLSSVSERSPRCPNSSVSPAAEERRGDPDGAHASAQPLPHSLPHTDAAEPLQLPQLQRQWGGTHAHGARGWWRSLPQGSRAQGSNRDGSHSQQRFWSSASMSVCELTGCTTMMLDKT